MTDAEVYCNKMRSNMLKCISKCEALELIQLYVNKQKQCLDPSLLDANQILKDINNLCNVDITKDYIAEIKEALSN